MASLDHFDKVSDRVSYKRWDFPMFIALRGALFASLLKLGALRLGGSPARHVLVDAIAEPSNRIRGAIIVYALG